MSDPREDDGTDRAMSDHVARDEFMVDEDLEAGVSDETVDDVDFDSSALQDGTEGNQS